MFMDCGGDGGGGGGDGGVASSERARLRCFVANFAPLYRYTSTHAYNQCLLIRFRRNRKRVRLVVLGFWIFEMNTNSHIPHVKPSHFLNIMMEVYFVLSGKTQYLKEIIEFVMCGRGR